MTSWLHMLKGDPLPWLLEEGSPAVRHLALRQLLDQPKDAPEVRQARSAATQSDPIAAILAAQQPEGFWVKPGPGYTPKYRGTIWQLIFLDQLGADGADSRVQAACDPLELRSGHRRISGWPGQYFAEQVLVSTGLPLWLYCRPPPEYYRPVRAWLCARRAASERSRVAPRPTRLVRTLEESIYPPWQNLDRD